LINYYAEPAMCFSNSLNINKKDTIITKAIYIKLDKIELKKRTYFLTIAYRFFENWNSKTE
jgi:hypothetical protein